jgi:cysteine desulfurase
MIYLDNAATTRICDEALEEMMPFLKEEYASPLGQYSLGFRANSALNTARGRVAALIGADVSEVIFTSCATESNNLFLRGFIRNLLSTGMDPAHKSISIVTQTTEHASVLNTCEDIAREYDRVRLIKVPVDRNGFVNEAAYREALKERPDVVSIMHVNNETGAVNDIKRLCGLAHEAGAIFHTDAVQSVPHMRVNVREIGVDALSVSGHKLHGPKGSGFLYLRKGVIIKPVLTGGGQEIGLRSGTPDVVACVGLGKACEELFRHGSEDRTAARAASVFAAGLKEVLPAAVINRPGENMEDSGNYLSEIVSVSIPGGDALSIIPDLDMAGVCCSSGAACSAGRKGVSHVLTAMGIGESLAKGTLRFSFSRYNTEGEAAEAAVIVGRVVKKNLENHGILFK